jgi:hypothetical protein
MDSTPTKCGAGLSLLAALLLACLASAGPKSIPNSEYPKAARAQLEAEQQRNDLSLLSEAYVSPSDSAVPIDFQPQTGKSFRVPYIPLPLHELDLLGDQTDANFLFDGDRFRFLVHPAGLESYRKLIEKYGLVSSDYRAASTSSARSLILWRESNPDIVYSVKLSLNLMQSGRTREVTPAEALHAVLVSELLKTAEPKLETKAKLAGIPESFAAVPKSVGAGLIVKRLSKTDLLFDPVFSAFSKKSGERQSHLEAVALQEGRKLFDVAAEFTESLLSAINRHYQETGIIPEPHSQNLLYRKVRRGWIFRFRDFSGAAVNYDLRATRGLDSSALVRFQNRPGFSPDYEITRGKTYFAKALTLHFFRGVVSTVDRAYNFGGKLENRIAILIQHRLDSENAEAPKRIKYVSRAGSCESLFNTPAL